MPVSTWETTLVAMTLLDLMLLVWIAATVAMVVILVQALIHRR
jgi:hypothetical protein